MTISGRSPRKARPNPDPFTRLFFRTFATLWIAIGTRQIMAAEDPNRFLQVQSWLATFTHTVHETGSLAYEDQVIIFGPATANWSYIHSMTVTCRLELDPGTADNPLIRSFFSNANLSGTVVINDKFEIEGESTTLTVTVKDQGIAPNFWNVMVFPAEKKFLWFGSTPPAEGKQVITTVIGPLEGPVPVRSILNTATNDLPASGMNLSGRASIPMRDAYGEVTPAATWFTFGDERAQIPGSRNPLGPQLFTSNVELTCELSPILEELELVVEIPNYQDWLPAGDLKDWTKPGDIKFVKASLRTKEGGTPKSKAKWVRFELSDVSHEPGVCLNRPKPEFANQDPDLRFQTEFNKLPFVSEDLQVASSGMTATTPDGEYSQVEAGLSSFDFGAYGKLKVTAEVNGRELVGYLKDDPAKQKGPILLPKRQPESRIADKWKESHKATGLADDSDEENDPVGDGHPGDGLTLYEEYRGFSEGGSHAFGDPKKKDFFVADAVRSADSVAGLWLFQAQTGLNLHARMLPDEFRAPFGANGESIDTFLNFNNSPATHQTDQHGIVILARLSSSGASYAGPNPDLESRGTGGTPGRYRTVSIDPSAHGWRNVTASDGSARIDPIGPSTIAHELAHTCAVWHHGEIDQRNVLWTILSGKVFEGGLEIDTRYENGTPHVPYFPGTPTQRHIWIGAPHGQHSGNDQCFMRYDVATAYRSALHPTIRYLVNEVNGSILCTSPSGTGVNDPGHKPESRYGDASAGRGNCRAQICVNDKHNTSNAHKR